MIYIGTAAWNIPGIAKEKFSLSGSHLERYAQVLNAVEINTSFYRDHQGKTYAKWAQSTPPDFRFSVKVHRRFTHSQTNIDWDDLKNTVKNIAFLEEKLGLLLIQFPGSKGFSAPGMRSFYSAMREVYHGPVVLEARNLSWMHEDSLKLLQEFNISKVKADPEKCPGDVPGELEYFRLHGSPEIYKSPYADSDLKNLSLAIQMSEQKNKKGTWCIFDNTTFGYATLNALTLKDLIQNRSSNFVA